MSETRTDWLEQRRTGIGSSDAAAILGLDPRRNALDVYLDKVGETPLDGMEQTEAMYFGKELEPVIAAAYERKVGVKLVEVPLMRSKDLPFMLANIDRVEVETGKIVELKAPTAWSIREWGDENTDDIPDVYVVQVMHQIIVKGDDVAAAAALIGGSDFRVFRINRSDKLVRTMVEKETRFWEDHVMKRVPPEIEPTAPGAVDSLRKRYAELRDGAVDLGARGQELFDEYLAAHAEEKGGGERKDAVKAELVRMLEGRSAGSLPNGKVVTQSSIAEAVVETYVRKAYLKLNIPMPRGKKK